MMLFLVKFVSFIYDITNLKIMFVIFRFGDCYVLHPSFLHKPYLTCYSDMSGRPMEILFLFHGYEFCFISNTIQKTLHSFIL